MNLWQRITGIFVSPRETFSWLAEKPIWLDAMIIVLVASLIYGFLVAPFSARDQFEITSNSPKMKEFLRQRMGEDGFNKYMERIQKEAETPSAAVKIRSGLSVGIMALIAVFIQAILLLIIARLITGSTLGNYRQLLSALFHASFINAIAGNALRFVLVSVKQSVYKISTGLAVFFPKLEFTSATYIILNNIDFFQLWMFGILGYALSAIFKVDLKKSLVTAYLFWVLKTAVNIALTLFSLRLYQ
ncbi:MAG: hypothetical protein WBI18_01940 [Candidatus Saccharicenans sp.]